MEIAHVETRWKNVSRSGCSSLRGGRKMRPGLKTTLAAVAMAANAAAFCSGTAHAFTFLPGGGPGQPPPGSFTVADKLFDNFTCTAAGTLCGGVSYLPAPGGALGPEF